MLAERVPTEEYFPMRASEHAARVLVVEDDPEMRSLLAETLAEEGYRAIAVGDTFSALVELLGDGADLLVTDWKMPAMDGLDLLRSVRRCMPNLPVVFITGYAHDDLRRRALMGGAFSFLAKPFHRADFLSHVRSALASGRATTC
jgi:CheY-like chemotaxis protein